MAPSAAFLRTAPNPPKIRWSSLNWSNIQVLSANNSQRECREASVEEQNHQVWTIERVYIYIILYYIRLYIRARTETVFTIAKGSGGKSVALRIV